MGSREFFPPRSKPLAAEGGIKAQSRQGDFGKSCGGRSGGRRCWSGSASAAGWRGPHLRPDRPAC
ncbi:MAG: hypothetical protein U0736_00345 [Gemmataceae bacterium]